RQRSLLGSRKRNAAWRAARPPPGRDVRFRAPLDHLRGTGVTLPISQPRPNAAVATPPIRERPCDAWSISITLSPGCPHTAAPPLLDTSRIECALARSGHFSTVSTR